MNRVLFKAMEQREGKYLYRDKEFSGVGFSITADGKVSAFEVKDGRVAGPYSPICAPDKGEFIQVDLTGQLSDYEAPRYSGEPYSGVGYEFAGDICDHEIFLLKSGAAYSEAQWDKNGVLLYFDVPNDSFGEVYEWYPDASIKSVDISTNESFFGSLAFTEDGKLRFLSSSRGFLQQLAGIREQARFLPIRSVSDLATLTWADDVTLFGDDIDDDLLTFLVGSGLFNATRKLRLSRTSIKSLNLPGKDFLRELDIEDGSDMRYLANLHATPAISLAHRVKTDRPDLRVVLNRREVK